MPAYTETNFNACLEVISAFKSQRDAALRLAHRYSKLVTEEIGQHISTDCPCGICELEKQLSTLTASVIAYQLQHQRK